MHVAGSLIFLGAAFAAEPNATRWRSLNFIALGAIALAIFASGRTAAIAALFMGSFVFFITSSKNFKNRSANKLFITAGIIITVFLFVISWSWTDTFYSSIFFGNFKVLSNTIFYIDISELGFGRNTLMDSLITNTASLLLLAPLIIIYIFSQKKIMQGIERSGIVG